MTILNFEQSKEIVDASGKVHVPDGYLWCMHCKALCPHTDGKCTGWHDCVVCGTTKFGIVFCDVCGWEPEEDDTGPNQFVEVLHWPGCHCDDISPLVLSEGESDQLVDIWASSHSQRIARQFFQNNKIDLNQKQKNAIIYQKCGCKQVTIYRNLHVFNYWSRPGFSLDCYDAREWGSDIRCPVCGNVFSWNDGNC